MSSTQQLILSQLAKRHVRQPTPLPNSSRKEASRSPKNGCQPSSTTLEVFKYATKWDFIVYLIASLASVGAGLTLPLMTIIFGQLVGQFTEFYKATSILSNDGFRHILNEQAVLSWPYFLVVGV